jgi:tetratricopeptide (TPR) repeat protein
MSKPSYLDADELLQLAIAASQKDDHETAITNLKRALEISPDNAKVHYFLGAEHAQIGLYDRAITEMERAVNLDPNLVTAIFQLGLLYLTSGQVEKAIEAWAPLDKQGDENCFYLFKTGMIHLARDEFDECEQSLKKGIALNNFNEALNNDMRRILTDIDERRNDGRIATNSQPSQTQQAPGKDGSHFFLSAYKDSN